MNIAFNDERINSGQGSSFRETSFFVLAFSLIYTIAVGILGLYIGDSVVVGYPFSALTSASTALASGLVIAIGELAHKGSYADEFARSRRDAYYQASFRVLVCIFATVSSLNIGFYCFAAPMLNSWVVKRNEVLYFCTSFEVAMSVSAALFLIMRLRSRRIMLNSRVIEGDPATYYKSVFTNIAKLGVICLGLSLLSLSAFVLLSVRGSSGFGPVAAIRAGIYCVGIWLMLSVIYLVISAAERSSERAEEQGRVSSATLLIFIIGVTFVILNHFLNLGAGTFLPVNTPEFAMLLSDVRMIFSVSGEFLLALAVIYFTFELRGVSESLAVCCTVYVTVTLVTYVISTLLGILTKAAGVIVSAGSKDLLNDLLYASAYVSFAISGIVFVLSVTCLVLALKRIWDRSLISRKPIFAVVFIALILLVCRSLYNLLGSSEIGQLSSAMEVCYHALIIGVAVIIKKRYKNEIKE